MGLDDLVGKAKDAFDANKDKIDDVLHSDQAEDISDKVLGGVAGLAKKVAPDSLDDKIDGAVDAADKAIGND
ncbi:MAG: hypothetical protein QM607_07995 [Microbacterium sp.]